MKQESYYRVIEVRDMLDWLEYEPFGYAPNGNIRLGMKDESQPTFSLSHEEIKSQFLAKYRFEPIRKGSWSLRVLPI